MPDKQDKTTLLNGIKLADCIDRRLYRLNSRNLDFGVFRQESGGFNGLREKFGSVFIFEEYHYDKGPPFGTVVPLELLPETLPAEIELSCTMPGSFCQSCEQLVEFVPDQPDKRTPGKWFHLDRLSPCTTCKPYARYNQALYDWLVATEKTHSSESRATQLLEGKLKSRFLKQED